MTYNPTGQPGSGTYSGPSGRSGVSTTPAPSTGSGRTTTSAPPAPATPSGTTVVQHRDAQGNPYTITVTLPTTPTPAPSTRAPSTSGGTSGGGSTRTTTPTPTTPSTPASLANAIATGNLPSNAGPAGTVYTMPGGQTTTNYAVATNAWAQGFVPGTSGSTSVTMSPGYAAALAQAEQQYGLTPGTPEAATTIQQIAQSTSTTFVPGTSIPASPGYAAAVQQAEIEAGINPASPTAAKQLVELAKSVPDKISTGTPVTGGGGGVITTPTPVPPTTVYTYPITTPVAAGIAGAPTMAPSLTYSTMGGYGPGAPFSPFGLPYGRKVPRRYWGTSSLEYGEVDAQGNVIIPSTTVMPTGYLSKFSTNVAQAVSLPGAISKAIGGAAQTVSEKIGGILTHPKSISELTGMTTLAPQPKTEVGGTKVILPPPTIPVVTAEQLKSYNISPSDVAKAAEEMAQGKLSSIPKPSVPVVDVGTRTKILEDLNKESEKINKQTETLNKQINIYKKGQKEYEMWLNGRWKSDDPASPNYGRYVTIDASGKIIPAEEIGGIKAKIDQDRLALNPKNKKEVDAFNAEVAAYNDKSIKWQATLDKQQKNIVEQSKDLNQKSSDINTAFKTINQPVQERIESMKTDSEKIKNFEQSLIDKYGIKENFEQVPGANIMKGTGEYDWSKPTKNMGVMGIGSSYNKDIAEHQKMVNDFNAKYYGLAKPVEVTPTEAIKAQLGEGGWEKYKQDVLSQVEQFNKEGTINEQNSATVRELYSTALSLTPRSIGTYEQIKYMKNPPASVAGIQKEWNATDTLSKKLMDYDTKKAIETGAEFAAVTAATAGAGEFVAPALKALQGVQYVGPYANLISPLFTGAQYATKAAQVAGMVGLGANLYGRATGPGDFWTKAKVVSDIAGMGLGANWLAETGGHPYGTLYQTVSEQLRPSFESIAGTAKNIVGTANLDRLSDRYKLYDLQSKLQENTYTRDIYANKLADAQASGSKYIEGIYTKEGAPGIWPPKAGTPMTVDQAQTVLDKFDTELGKTSNDIDRLLGVMKYKETTIYPSLKPTVVPGLPEGGSKFYWPKPTELQSPQMTVTQQPGGIFTPADIPKKVIPQYLPEEYDKALELARIYKGLTGDAADSWAKDFVKGNMIRDWVLTYGPGPSESAFKLYPGREAGIPSLTPETDVYIKNIIGGTEFIQTPYTPTNIPSVPPEVTSLSYATKIPSIVTAEFKGMEGQVFPQRQFALTAPGETTTTILSRGQTGTAGLGKPEYVSIMEKMIGGKVGPTTILSPQTTIPSSFEVTPTISSVEFPAQSYYGPSGFTSVPFREPQIVMPRYGLTPEMLGKTTLTFAPENLYGQGGFTAAPTSPLWTPPSSLPSIYGEGKFAQAPLVQTYGPYQETLATWQHPENLVRSMLGTTTPTEEVTIPEISRFVGWKTVPGGGFTPAPLAPTAPPIIPPGTTGTIPGLRFIAPIEGGGVKVSPSTGAITYGPSGAQGLQLKMNKVNANLIPPYNELGPSEAAQQTLYSEIIRLNPNLFGEQVATFNPDYGIRQIVGGGVLLPPITTGGGMMAPLDIIGTTGLTLTPQALFQWTPQQQVKPFELAVQESLGSKLLGGQIQKTPQALIQPTQEALAQYIGQIQNLDKDKTRETGLESIGGLVPVTPTIPPEAIGESRGLSEFGPAWEFGSMAFPSAMLGLPGQGRRGKKGRRQIISNIVTNPFRNIAGEWWARQKGMPVSLPKGLTGNFPNLARISGSTRPKSLISPTFSTTDKIKQLVGVTKRFRGF